MRKNIDVPDIKFTIEEYADSGCFQFENFGIGLGLYSLTDGHICNGCPKYEGGRCSSFKTMMNDRSEESTAQVGSIFPDSLPNKSKPYETVRQEAERLGVSISEVRRRRNSAKISEA